MNMCAFLYKKIHCDFKQNKNSKNIMDGGLRKLPIRILVWCLIVPILLGSSRGVDPILIHMCCKYNLLLIFTLIKNSYILFQILFKGINLKYWLQELIKMYHFCQLGKKGFISYKETLSVFFIWHLCTRMSVKGKAQKYHRVEDITYG